MNNCRYGTVTTPIRAELYRTIQGLSFVYVLYKLWVLVGVILCFLKMVQNTCIGQRPKQGVNRFFFFNLFLIRLRL